MNRQDYIVLARWWNVQWRAAKEPEVREFIKSQVNSLGIELALHFPRFDRKLFIDTCLQE